jgi:transcriptional regulator with XRE-family HTH domain
MPNQRRSVKLRLENLPGKLRGVRKHLGLSQSQLAARLTQKPHYGRVSEYKRGRRTPSLLTLLDYARLGGIHIDDLVDDNVEITLIKQTK